MNATTREIDSRMRTTAYVCVAALIVTAMTVPAMGGWSVPDAVAAGALAAAITVTALWLCDRPRRQVEEYYALSLDGDTPRFILDRRRNMLFEYDPVIGHYRVAATAAREGVRAPRIDGISAEDAHAHWTLRELRDMPLADLMPLAAP